MKGWPGWADLGGWSHTEINVPHWELNLDTVTHLSTNRARRWLTSLIETNALTSSSSGSSSAVVVITRATPLLPATIQNKYLFKAGDSSTGRLYVICLNSHINQCRDELPLTLNRRHRLEKLTTNLHITPCHVCMQFTTTPPCTFLSVINSTDSFSKPAQAWVRLPNTPVRPYHEHSL